MRALVAAGGTAGHVLPALALARTLADGGDDVRFLGTPGGQEVGLVAAAGFPFVAVDARPVPRRAPARAAAAVLADLRAVGACRGHAREADVVVGMGGYASVPAGLAASLVGTPLVLHEQNAIPGLANRLLARRADVVALSFPEAAARLGRGVATRVTGNPVRSAVRDAARERAGDGAQAARSRAASALGLDPDRPTLVVFGGSLGAARINGALAAAADLLGGTQVLLLAGTAHADALRRTLPAAVRVEGFLDRMEFAYAVADVVVARAGATTCAEVALCGIPAILVPYPHATAGHQEANARALEVAGAVEVVMDDRLDGDALATRVIGLLGDRARRDAMAAAGRAWARPDAAEALATLVRSVA